MARRKGIRYRTRTVTKYARSRASRKGLKGAMKPVTSGIIAGAVQSLIPNDMLGGYADSLAPLGVGYFMNDKTLMTIGGYQIGMKLSAGIGGKGSANTGFWE